jgi:putative DNA primase/helicase
MSPRTITTSAAPLVSDEQIEQARATSIVDYVKSFHVELTKRGKKQPEYWGLCPLHNEDTPSLAVNAEKKVFHCHGCGAGGDVIDFAMQKHRITFVEAVRLLAGEEKTTTTEGPLGPIIAVYPYGERHRVTRHHQPKKTFRPWHRQDEGSPWIMGEGGDKWPLYREAELRNADPSAWRLIAEGEKDAERLAELGFTATTNAGGADRWRAEFAERFRGMRVCILEDNDQAGERRVESVGSSLVGIAAEIRALRFLGLPPKGDVSDWLDAGHTADELAALIEDAPGWQPSAGSASTDSKPNASRLVIRTMSSIEAKETDWLWKRWLPRGKLGLLAGLAGDGKSTLLAQIAAIGSVAGTLPDGTQAPLFRSLFMLGEDALDDTLRPRLDLHGADADQVFAIETVLDDDGNHRFFNVEKHLPLLEEAIGDYRIDFLCIDPLTTITPGTDRNAEGDTRDSLTPLIKLGDRLNVAICGIAHVGKPSPANRTAAQRILGATAIHALARVILMTASADDDRMVLGVVKSNLAMKPDPLVWTRAEDGPITWHGVSDQNVEDLLQGAVSKAPRADAEGFLRELLTAGSMASSDVEREAKAVGISWRTLRRAADDLGVEKWREGGADGHWRWRLPDGQPRYAETVPASNLSTFPTVDKFPASNLATPIHTEVDKLDTLHNGNLSNGVEGGHLRASAPLFENGVANAEVNIMVGGQLVHTDVLGSGQVRPLDHGVEAEPAVAETAANLATLTAEEIAQFRAEVDAAAPDDPHIRHDRAALAHFDALHSVDASVAITTSRSLRPRAAGWTS